MNWSRFKFYCIDVSRRLEQAQPVAQAFTQASSSVLATELGSEPKRQDISHTLLAQLKSGEYSASEVQQALAIYQQLDCSALSQQPSRLRRFGIYLGYLILMYFILTSVYAIFVIPVALELFEMSNMPAPSSFLWFAAHWASLGGLVLLLLVGALLLSLQVQALFQYRTGIEKSMIFRWLMPKSIKTRYAQVLALLHLPLGLAKPHADIAALQSCEKMLQYLRQEAYSMSEVSGLLSLMLSEQLSALQSAAETLLRRIYIAIAIVMIFSIYMFISSGYAPLFMMGEIT